jgi:F-type H+-transporting ATPase subunit g
MARVIADRFAALIPPTVYYARVGLELSRMVFQGQKMTPPYVLAAEGYSASRSSIRLTLATSRSLAQFQSYLQPAINVVKSPKTLLSSASSITPKTVLSSIRNTNRQQLITLSVAGAEVLGFFTVGTMIGRMKVIGYHGEPIHEH